MPELPPTVDNKISVLILQHPQEQDRVLGTARLLAGTLARVRIAVGLSWRNLSHALAAPAEPRNWGVLYLGSAPTQTLKAQALRGGPLVALDRKRQPLADQQAARAELEGLVALDRNWSQAKAQWWSIAWLTKLRRFVVIPISPTLT